MKHLLIVQDIPTQFDMPLYNYLAEHARFRLTVIYTQVRQPGVAGIDMETGRAPRWDHVEHEVYDRIYLNRQQARRPAEVVALVAVQAPDLVVVSGYAPSLHRKLVRPLKKRGFRLGLRSDNTLRHSNLRGIRGLVKKLVLPLWLRRYDSWHPVGSLARAYLEALSHTRRPTFLFPYNVDNAWFARQAATYRRQRECVLQSMGFEPTDFIVLGIMKWHEREDPLLLIRAFRELVRARPTARLVLVGDGPLRDTVGDMLADIKGNVNTPGYLPYSLLPSYYALADVFVHPAPGESWGVSVNEALACGVPVVASAGVGAGVDLVEEGVTGHVFPAGDWKALAKRLVGMADSECRAAMRAACIEKMEQWSYQQTNTAFEQALALTD
jgi:glycosyltransferase involved in cell wall biosynthesis